MYGSISWIVSSLTDLIDEGHVIVYLDDILIFTDTPEQHKPIVVKVLETLRKHKLYLKASKCFFEQRSVDYFGTIVGNGEIRMDPSKVDTVTTWPVPKCKRDVQSFLGFCNFYRRFMQGFSLIAQPLTRLTKAIPWEWMSKEQEAFEHLKSALVSYPVLRIPINDAPFRVECDSSDFANGAVLSQLIDGRWHPIAYRSRTLTKTERNYEIHHKEMMAIIDSLQDWRQYLMGAAHVFEVWSDHLNLQYFRKPQKLNRRQARWKTEMQEFNFVLIHKPGPQMKKADLITRRADFKTGENDNHDVTLLNDDLFTLAQDDLYVKTKDDLHIAAIDVEPIADDLMRRILRCRNNKDKSVTKALDEKDNQWTTLENGLVMWKHRVYVPKDSKLREDIIRLHHDTPLAGHPGRYKTHELITRNYWWPGIMKDIRKYVEGCEKCQRAKPIRQKPQSTLHPHEIPSEPWQIIMVDLIGELPESGGYNAISVFVDKFTKRLRLVPTNMSLTSEGTARMYRDKIFSQHGIPRMIIHDRGPQFHSGFMKELYKLIGIKSNFTTAYHPQTNGQTERMNQEIEHYL